MIGMSIFSFKKLTKNVPFNLVYGMEVVMLMEYLILSLNVTIAS